MSEFKFSCPVCGKNVSCDRTLAGTQLACPHCNSTIGVPSGFTESADVSTQTDTPPPWTGYNATTTQRTSGLAIASLICSLASLITCIGWLPGIICGHIAKSRIRRNSSLKGNGIATAGLVIGYLILLLEAGTVTIHVWRISTAMKQGYKNVRQDLATNNFVTQIQSAIVSNINQQTQSIVSATVVTNNPPVESNEAVWTSDIATVSFPNHPISGKLHGIDFTFKTALFRNGEIRINSNEGTSIEIIHGLGESIDGQSYQFQSTDADSANPHVKMTWNQDDIVQSQTFSKGYGMKLQFGHIMNRKASAKIYLCLPDDSKSYLAGTFEVRIVKPKKQ